MNKRRRQPVLGLHRTMSLEKAMQIPGFDYRQYFRFDEDINFVYIDQTSLNSTSAKLIAVPANVYRTAGSPEYVRGYELREAYEHTLSPSS